MLLRRGFRPSCLGAAETRVSTLAPNAVVLAETSPASGVWDSAFDDLSLMIFRQPTGSPIRRQFDHLTDRIVKGIK